MSLYHPPPWRDRGTTPAKLRSLRHAADRLVVGLHTRMRLLSLDLKNIGPFDEAHLDFRAEPGSDEPEVVPVTFVTGENGTGKSIVIDAIRAAFGPGYAQLSRNILRDNDPFELAAMLFDGTNTHRISDIAHKGELHIAPYFIGDLPGNILQGSAVAPWVVDYWQSTLDTDSFQIESLTRPRHNEFLMQALQGKRSNTSATQLICHIDYLRDSRDPQEKRYGELLYKALEHIARAAVPDGRFAHVTRSRLEPVFEQRGRFISIEKLSAGSLYLIQCMLGLMGRMYSCHVVTGRQGDDILALPGLLLIDEPENHLHPKWQKRFIPTIQKVFPNLQIIVATHSPFILASTRGARVFVCRAEGDHCVAEDVSDDYADRPVDEILRSPAFADTPPFSQEITDLLEQRKAAIALRDEAERKRIEAELLARNREYFDYFHVEELVKKAAGGNDA